MTVTQDDIQRQIAWEIESVERGVQRYREAQSDGTVADSNPGQEMLSRIMRPLVIAIKAAQEEAIAGISAPKGRPSTWWWPILLLSAEKMAVITARVPLQCIGSGLYATGMAATAAAVMIASQIKTEREFELWREAQGRREKEAKTRGDKAVNLYKLMLGRVKKVDARTASKWMRQSKQLDRIEWTTEMKVHVGMKLLALLIEHSGGFFDVGKYKKVTGRRLQTVKLIVLTDEAKEFLYRRHAQNELTRPWLMPMLVPPVPWTRTEEFSCVPSVQESS